MEFKSTDLANWILKALEDKKITEMTAIQEESYKLVNQKNNVIISSPTGTGKTFCYLLPILNNLNIDLKSLQAIIIVPTKELAMQIYDQLRYFVKYNSAIRIKLVNTSDKLLNYKQVQSNQILVATVFKTKQLINDGLVLKDVNTLVLDEADMLIDYGFYKDIDYIVNKLTNPYLQKIALSASIDANLANQFKKFIKNAKIVTSEKSIWVNDQIKHNVVYQRDNSDQFDTFKKLIKQITPYFAIIFASTKKDAEMIYQYMVEQKLNVTMLHKDLSSRERKNIFNKLQTNEFQYLVATDLASRGIDIDGVSDVISYSLPKDDIWYLHRSGRTGRKDYQGNSYVIYSNKDEHQLNRLTKKAVKWTFLLIDKDAMVVQEKKLHYKKAIVDPKMKLEISKLYNNKTQKVRPGYKKKIKLQVNKIKQKAKHEYLDKKFKMISNQKKRPWSDK